MAWSAVVLGLGLVAWSFRSGGIFEVLLSGDYSAAERVELVRKFFEGWGALAPIVYVGVVVVEVVVAPLPGIMLYAPGGMIFGGFLGGLLSLVGNVLGAGLSAWLMRAFGHRRLDRFLEGEKVVRFVEQLRAAGVWVILALRINPLTTSDLVSYAAGLAGIPIWKVMVGTAIGMAPLCWLQAYLAEELFRAAPWLIYPLVVLALIYLVAALWLVRRSLRRP